MEKIQGIWYEETRRRWRVKLFKDGTLYHRSYHTDYDEAFLKWREIKREIARSRFERARTELTPMEKFLRQPPPASLRIKGATRR